MTRANPKTPAKIEDSSAKTYDIEQVVRERYAAGAEAVQPELCCPVVDYNHEFLDVLPPEILEKDYGCGDPSKYVSPGEVVVDLGSGAGKVCYILSQKVGRRGAVIGVDCNDQMLALARKYETEIGKRIGYQNVRFVKGRIQDLALDAERVAALLRRHPVGTIEELSAFETECERLRRDEPMIRDNSVDVVVSNCVLNLVRPADKRRLFGELFRVLKRGGRAVISDIVSDEDPTPDILGDPDLWSGCIAGAFREDRFLQMFEEARFYGIEILSRSKEPWHTINGIEFRSMTVRAYKGKEGACLERHQAVTYRGPWRSVTDDDGHVLHRGRRMAVCDKTFKIYTDPKGPYADDLVPIKPLIDVPRDDAKPFDCHSPQFRHPRQTKGEDYRETTGSDPTQICDTDGCC